MRPILSQIKPSAPASGGGIIVPVIRRFYVHNYRCLENFELPIGGLSSALLIGNNGSGKSTVADALQVLQKIARGTNRIRQLVPMEDISQSRSDVPVRFEIEVAIGASIFEYTIAFQLPANSKELRVLEERLRTDERTIYERHEAAVQVVRAGPDQDRNARFQLDWHLAALPIIQEQNSRDPLHVFRQWLKRIVILRPAPSLMSGESNSETLEPGLDGSDFGAWFSGLLSHAPAAYTRIDQFLKQVIPDLKDIQNPPRGGDSKQLFVQYGTDIGELTVSFKKLSDGEKCFMLCAMVLAASYHSSTLFCFWDEPDSHLAPSEVSHFVLALRKAFSNGSQFVATSHNPEAIRAFTNDNTFLLHRKTHMEPTLLRRIDELQITGDLVDALTRGDVAPQQ